MTEFKNYICIDGKKAELTEEQLKALGIELPKASPFKKESCKKEFYYINPRGSVVHKTDFQTYIEREMYEVANYCTDYNIMKQRALHETLNRLLWRYSMEHDGDKIDWGTTVTQRKYNILYHDVEKKFEVSWIYSLRNGTVIQIHGKRNCWLGNNPEAIPSVIRWLRQNNFKCTKEILTCTATGYGQVNNYVELPVVVD